MVGNRAATIYELEAGAGTAERLPTAVPMCWLGGTAQGIDWRVLKEQQRIPLPFRNPFFLELFFEVPTPRHRESVAKT